MQPQQQRLRRTLPTTHSGSSGLLQVPLVNIIIAGVSRGISKWDVSQLLSLDPASNQLRSYNSPIYAASAQRPTSVSISTQLTMVTHKRCGFFCMSCALDRYLSCEAHLGPAWSYSESRQGTQTKTNYAWALGGSQWERLKTSLTEESPTGHNTEVDKGDHFILNSNMLSQI